ncbi:MAG TPA: DUF1918 domain-containing protein [Jatrophihabitans sp.]|nr:DUF1918 domain-containing protein [Jatrophihabitans sp.]
MFAQVGDWLVVSGRTNDQPARRGEIREVHGAEGAPPYLVHWTDRDHDALVYPGPDSHILTPTQLAAEDEARDRQIEKVQHLIEPSGY